MHVTLIKIAKIRDLCMDWRDAWLGMKQHDTVYEDILKLKGVLKDMKVSNGSCSKL